MTRIWAGGDLGRHGALFVARSGGRLGERAARAIDRGCARRRRRRPTRRTRCARQRAGGAASLAIGLHAPPRSRRAPHPPRRPAAVNAWPTGTRCSSELDVAKALAEAQRRFLLRLRASTATSCVIYCPDLAVQRIGEGYA